MILAATVYNFHSNSMCLRNRSPNEMLPGWRWTPGKRLIHSLLGTGWTQYKWVNYYITTAMLGSRYTTATAIVTIAVAVNRLKCWCSRANEDDYRKSLLIFFLTHSSLTQSSYSKIKEIVSSFIISSVPK